MAKNKIRIKSRIIFAVILFSPILLPVSGCQPTPTGDGKIGVVVTVPPQIEFITAVGGDRVSVTAMVPASADPHTYEPSPAQLVEVSRARIYAKVGSAIEFEIAWLGRLLQQNRDIKVVDCANGVDLSPELDPHIWTSPAVAKIMVANIYRGLVETDPAGADYYTRNRDSYLAELDKLDQDTRNALAGARSHVFLVYHPFAGYFAREYGLTMLAIEEEGKEPTAADLARLIEQARGYGIKAIFASTEFNPQTIQVVADNLGARIIRVNPLSRDYLQMMRGFVNELVGALNG